MHPQYSIRTFIRQYFNETIRLEIRSCSRIWRVWEFSNFVIDIFLPQSLLRFANPSNFWICIYYVGYAIVIHCSRTWMNVRWIFVNFFTIQSIQIYIYIDIWLPPLMLSTAITASSSALWASIGPWIQSPIA